jgi:hypothetical protein
MTNEVKLEQVSEHEPHHFSVEASQLRWPPGEFPRIIDTDMGNRQQMVLTSLTEHKATYSQQLGCITLTVWND